MCLTNRNTVRETQDCSDRDQLMGPWHGRKGKTIEWAVVKKINKQNQQYQTNNDRLRQPRHSKQSLLPTPTVTHLVKTRQNGPSTSSTAPRRQRCSSRGPPVSSPFAGAARIRGSIPASPQATVIPHDGRRWNSGLGHRRRRLSSQVV